MNKIVLTEVLNKSDILHTIGVNIGLLALEAYASKNSKKEIIVTDNLDSVFKIKPDLVGVSSTSENYGRATEAAKSIKAKLHIPVIIGGPHITSIPESLDPIFDAAVIGEGEETFLELINLFPKTEKIDGLAYWKNKKLIINKRRAPIADLDSLPMLNRKKWIKKIGLGYLMTTRGCPYKCSFCSSPVIWGGCRSFSPERVITEIKDIIDKFGLKFFIFYDDVFTLNKKRLKAIVERLKGDEITKNTVFSCLGRINLIDTEVIKLLKMGNIQFLFFGTEFASNSLLKKYKDKNPTIEEVQKTIDLLYNEGINIRTSFIIGSPGETEKDLASTYNFIEKNKEKLFEVEINPLIAFPGTEIWEYALGKGLVDNHMDWSRLKEYPFLPAFNASKYIYLNEKVPYVKFLDYIKKFDELYRSITFAPRNLDKVKNYYKPTDFPARLKPMG